MPQLTRENFQFPRFAVGYSYFCQMSLFGFSFVYWEPLLLFWPSKIEKTIWFTVELIVWNCSTSFFFHQAFEYKTGTSFSASNRCDQFKEFYWYPIHRQLPLSPRFGHHFLFYPFILLIPGLSLSLVHSAASCSTLLLLNYC